MIHNVSGYRPDYKCQSFQNSSTNNNTAQWYEYSHCSVKTFTNRSGDVLSTETACENGWDYAIPVEQSFVTEVRTCMTSLSLSF